MTSVRREGNVWKVKHKHIPSGEEFLEDYDFVVVGTGHHSKPYMPSIPGEKLFNGNLHLSTNFTTHNIQIPQKNINKMLILQHLQVK